MNNIERILRALQSGQMKAGLESLVRFASEQFTEDSGLKNASINLLARYNQLQRRRIAGLIADSEMQITENQIRFSALELVDVLREEMAGDAGSVVEPVAPSEANRTKILFLGADPSNRARLDVDREVRKIEDALYDSKLNGRFELVKSSTTRPDDFMKLIMKHKPDIVHFSGHGDQEGVLLLDEKGESLEVSTEKLAEVFRFFREIVGCVVLNSCFSRPQAMRIHDYIPHVIGTSYRIENNAAMKFSSLFYTALADGKEIPMAYEFARIGTNLNDMDGDLFVML